MPPPSWCRISVKKKKAQISQDLLVQEGAIWLTSHANEESLLIQWQINVRMLKGGLKKNCNEIVENSEIRKAHSGNNFGNHNSYLITVSLRSVVASQFWEPRSKKSLEWSERSYQCVKTTAKLREAWGQLAGLFNIIHRWDEWTLPGNKCGHWRHRMKILAKSYQPYSDLLNKS